MPTLDEKRLNDQFTITCKTCGATDVEVRTDNLDDVLRLSIACHHCSNDLTVDYDN